MRATLHSLPLGQSTWHEPLGILTRGLIYRSDDLIVIVRCPSFISNVLMSYQSRQSVTNAVGNPPARQTLYGS